ncbi:MAG: HlyD family efflux transporter periplasmic adaptor subunit [candidate division Zixibacteria bacterium]|nr:HlyD family efflux transporter periplasmic adaptor subunit [candidate division Zixibacteria bacterium]
MKTYWLIIVVLAALVFTGCSGDNGAAGGSGLIEATDVLISAETSGRVLNRFVSEGDMVQPGDTLAVIDPSRLELELAAALAGRSVAEANLATARVRVEQARSARDFTVTELTRVERLLRSGTATRQLYDRAEQENSQARIALRAAEAGVRTGEAELMRIAADIARLERQLQDCFPVCPVAGIVIESFVEPGELITAGKPLAHIAGLDTVWVKVYLPSGSFASVTTGTSATVSTESGGQEYAGTVTWTSTEAEFTPKNVQTEQARADLVYAVKVTIPNRDGRLKIGMPVFVTLEQQ